MKSVLRSSALSCFFLLVSVASGAETVAKDQFLFRINQSVVGAHDLEVAADELRALMCRFPDSLLGLWLGEGFLPRMSQSAKELRTARAPLGTETSQTIFLSSVRQLWKLLLFVEGQNVTITSELLRALKVVRGCPGVTLPSKELRSSFLRWLRVEVYLRSRYAAGGLSGNQEWRTRRAQSIAQLVESLDKQFFHENFW